MFGKDDGKRKPPGQAEVWKKLAGRHGADLVMDRKGRKVKRVRFERAGWKVVLDTTVESSGESSQTYTRLRGLYTRYIDFRFRAYTKSIFSDLGKAFGMQDIEVGHPGVDDRWIIKADSEGRIQSLMILPAVVEGLSHAKSGRFESRRYKRSMPDVGELRYMMTGISTDEATLESSVTMMFTALAHLVRSGAAKPVPPEVEP